MSTRRLANGGGFLACVALLGFALYAQYVLHLEPCPLCIFQRIGVAAMGVMFLLAALHDPKPVGARVYAALLALATLFTIGIALRHIYIQHLPADAVPACGASLEFMLKIFPLADVVRKVLTGSGECARVTWTLLGLSMPTWVLLSAGALGTFGVWRNLRLAR
jgi:disulfide bond formation protein DsbB